MWLELSGLSLVVGYSPDLHPCSSELAHKLNLPLICSVLGLGAREGGGGWARAEVTRAASVLSFEESGPAQGKDVICWRRLIAEMDSIFHAFLCKATLQLAPQEMASISLPVNQD